MNVWHMIWILPLDFLFGYIIRSMMEGTQEIIPESWNPNRVYGEGDQVIYRGKILRCLIPGHYLVESWDPDKYPLAWEEVRRI